MNAAQRADDALESAEALRDGPLADLRRELAAAGSAALAKVEAFVTGALAALESDLRDISAGREVTPAPVAAPAAPAAAAKAKA